MKFPQSRSSPIDTIIKVQVNWRRKISSCLGNRVSKAHQHKPAYGVVWPDKLMGEVYSNFVGSCQPKGDNLSRPYICISWALQKPQKIRACIRQVDAFPNWRMKKKYNHIYFSKHEAEKRSSNFQLTTYLLPWKSASYAIGHEIPRVKFLWFFFNRSRSREKNLCSWQWEKEDTRIWSVSGACSLQQWAFGMVAR